MATGMAKEMKCARRGCSKPVPKVALLHNDKFCSTTCFRAAQGKMSAKDAAKATAAAERGAGIGDRGGWRRLSEASFERAYGKGKK